MPLMDGKRKSGSVNYQKDIAAVVPIVLGTLTAPAAGERLNKCFQK